MDRRVAMGGFAALLALAAGGFAGGLWAFGGQDDLLALCLVALAAAAMNTLRVALQGGARGGS